MAKNRAPQESFITGNTNGKFISLHFDMIDSKAWESLTAYEIQIYIAMRRNYTIKNKYKQTIESNKDNISMPKKEYSKMMHRDTFFKAIDGLIEKGFVRVIENRRHIRKCIIYGFVDKWQEYGQPGYEIPHNWKRNPSKKTD